MPKKEINVSTSEKVDIKLHHTNWNSDYSSSLVLSAIGACCHKITPFCQVHSKELLQRFRAVSSGRKKKSDENPNSSVFAETMKLLANSSYGYQIVDRSRHTVTKYLSDEKTHAAINSKLFKRLDRH